MMDHAVPAADISASVRSTSTNRMSQSSSLDGSTATLHILPLHSRRDPDALAWAKVRQALGQLADLPTGWNGGQGVRPDQQTTVFAAQELARLQQMMVPAPTINPSPDGAIYAEWHMKGMDIELIFEAPYQITALVEDSRHELPPVEIEGSDLGVMLEALKVLCSR